MKLRFNMKIYFKKGFKKPYWCKKMSVCVLLCVYRLSPGRHGGSWQRPQRWRRGCWGPSPRAWAGLGRCLAAASGGGALVTRWRRCRSRTGTPPGPCTPAGRRLRRRAASCPTAWGPERPTGGRCAPPPGSSPSPAPCWRLQEEERRTGSEPPQVSLSMSDHLFSLREHFLVYLRCSFKVYYLKCIM